MSRAPSAVGFLGICEDAPPPSGEEDPDLRSAMLQRAQSRFFQVRVSLWSWLTLRGSFDWEDFLARLNSASYRRFASWQQARRSLGWAGFVPENAEVYESSGITTRVAVTEPKKRPSRWLFGVLGWWVWWYGFTVMEHELFHAAQDFKDQLFSDPGNVLRRVLAEYSAHFWGGPLIGIPLIWIPTVGIIAFVVYGFGVLAEYLRLVWGL